jgi:hypothetical protein
MDRWHTLRQTFLANANPPGYSNQAGQPLCPSCWHKADSA